MSNRMKKILTIISAVLIIGLGTVGGFFLSRLIRQADMVNIVKGNKADVEWYDPDATEFVITTAEELYEFALLSDFYNFEGQTVKLGADIVINEGNANDWGKKAPTNSWYPIQKFAGRFDGQGHTISGLYGLGSDAKMGLFAGTQPSCVITDLYIKNSYFEMQGSEPVGSLASNGCGTFRKIYSDAIVVSNGFKAGGFIGEIDAAGTSAVLGSWSTFSDCWFDGSVSLTYKKSMYAGGFVGYSAAGTIVIEHCLNSGSVYSKLNHIGGFVGTAWATNVTVNISDSLNTGKLDAEWTNAVSATVGRIAKGASANFTDTFATAESYGTLYFKDGDGKVSGVVVQKTEKELTGEGGYRWTTLDFENHWAIQKEGTPVLQCFTEEIPSTEGLTKLFDTDWYDANLKEFTITTTEEFYGLQLLSLSTDFKGKTIKLGNNITINKGKASTWGKNAPETSWGGISGSTGTFAGTFDGQGHTISGVYLKNGATRQGLFGWTTEDAVVKNFRLVNSYFEYTGEDNALLGSIAGRAGGIIEKVYSDAIMVSNGRYVGGIVGQDQGTLKVSECWYDGKIMLTGENGWYAGGILGASQGSKKTDIEHCLNTADISTDMNHIGGIVGYAITAEHVLTIKDCLNVGKLTTVYHKNAVGSIIGRMGNGAVINILKTCSATESWESTVYMNDKAVFNGGAIRVDEAKLKGYGGYQWTELDFKNYWAVDLNSTPVLKCFAKRVPSIAGQTRLVDTSWYSDKASTYTLDSLADLYGFSLLSADNTFAGKTIKVGADITVNSGNASDWGSKPPALEWVSIAKFGTTRSFAGTFDGQGHTISGLYQKVDEMGAGLFQSCGETSVVKNLRLVNSYFECTSELYGIAGSISGRGDGRYENIYSDATIVSTGSRVGGIVGQAIGKTHISNCWYDGNITLTGENGWYGGGIAGVTETPDTNTIEHCLFTGSISTEMNHIGGICGYAMVKGTTLNIKDCLSVGTLTTVYHKNAVGSIIGRLANETVLNVENTTVSLETWECAIFGNDKATLNGGAIRIAKEQLNGYGGYQWTELNFNDYWAVQEKSTPVLKSFASAVIDTAGKERLVNTNWYDNAKSEYILKTKQDLHGFALLSSDLNFEGKTIKLGANITVNTGDASTWRTNAPAISWNSIGILGATRSFNGTFDGQGYTISGLYQKSNKYGVGLFQSCEKKSVVKNVILTNSYFESTNENTALIGSIAGRGAGTYKNVISDAIVVSAGAQSGGMIGQSGGDIVLSKCEFSGLLQTNNHYVAGMVGHADHEITIKNSTFSGDLASSGGMHNAGFVGFAKQYTKITDSEFSGTLSTGQDRAGGFIGTNMKQVDISGCVNSGTMTIEKRNYFGGYIGYNAGGATIDKSEFSGEMNCKGNYSGGFIGYSEALSDIQQSRFTGNLNTNAFSGGFIGWQIGTSGSIKHCLSSGTVSTTDNQVGSFVGCVANVGFTMDDCLYAGETTYSPVQWKYLIVGRVYGDNADVKITNTFAQGEAGWIAAGLNTTVGTLQDETLVCDEVFLQDINAYVMTTLDFDEYWRAVAGGYPELKAFDGSAELNIPANTLRADYEWYYDTSLFDNLLNRYTISDAGDWLGFAIISQRDDFAGYKVRIGDEDIVLNEGWTASATAPATVWMSIGNATKPFAGKFDGNGKTISGLYVNATTTNVGMFSTTAAVSEIGNFRLENSYFTSNQNYLGAIAGIGNGSFNKIYSNATVVGKSFIGGMLGGTNGAVNISECWLEGKVVGVDIKGGFIGQVNGGSVSISNCLNKMNVLFTTESANGGNQVGGYAGMVWNADFSITDSLAVGNVKSTSNAGSLVGRIGKNDGKTHAFTISNTYALNTSNAVTVGTNAMAASECNLQAVTLAESLLKGSNAYTNTALDFDNYWRAIEGGYPEVEALKGNNAMTLPSGIIRADYDWYGDAVYAANGNKYILSDARDLIGFAIISQYNDFAGKNVTLGDKDIVLNEGWAASATAPAVAWVPIGNATKPFAGSFDGNGKTISGLYVNATTTNVGMFSTTAATSKIGNFRLENSYFTSNQNYIGAIAGIGNGTFSKIYSNATVVAKSFSGGMIGGTNGVVNISECWLEGKFVGVDIRGGFIGHVNGGSVNISNCLNKMNVLFTTESANGGNQVGGYAGMVWNADFSIADSLSVGIVKSTSNAGSLVGRIGKNDGKTHAFKTSNTYALDTSHTVTVGTNAMTASECNLQDEIFSEELLKGSNAYIKTALDFDNYWRAIEGDYPELKALKGKDAMTLPDELTKADYSWYSDEAYAANGNKYILEDASDLVGFAILSQDTDFAGKNITLGDKDIVLNKGWTASTTAPATVWTPIGSATKQFAGTFDGNGKTISGLYVNATSDFVGMFAVTAASSDIKNFTLTNSSISNSGQYTGSVVGFGNGKLQNVKSSANVTGTNVWVGGLVGGNTANSLTIINCEYSGSMTTSSNNVGGLVGISKKSLTITGSKFSGTLNSSAGIFNGGFVGCNDGSLQISGSECSGTITAKTSYAGGFVGHAGVGVTITNSKYTGNMVLPTNQSYYGGFVGNGGAQIDISNCQYAGNIQGGQIVGGFVGAVTKGANIQHCLFASNGALTGSGNQNGGFIGMATGGTTTINDCLFVGTVPCFSDWGALLIGRATVSTVSIANTFVKGTNAQPTSKVQNTTINDQSQKYADAEALKGADVLNQISLDKTYWEAVNNDYPKLKNLQ